jgi:hypothetical protein
MSNQVVTLRTNDIFGYRIEIASDHVSITKLWNTGNDPGDCVNASLTFRKEDYKEIVSLISLYIDKEQNASKENQSN